MKDHYFGDEAVSDMPTGEVLEQLAIGLAGQWDWSHYVGTEPPEALIERLRIEILIRKLGLR